jgi:hypothetical protein
MGRFTVRVELTIVAATLLPEHHVRHGEPAQLHAEAFRGTMTSRRRRTTEAQGRRVSSDCIVSTMSS